MKRINFIILIAIKLNFLFALVWLSGITEAAPGPTPWGVAKLDSRLTQAPWDFLGYSVAVSGDIAVVGAPNDEINAISQCGTVYIFNREPGVNNLWRPHTRLFPYACTPGSKFGASVAIDGNTIIVGAPTYDNFHGAIEIFHRDANDWWNRVQRLSEPVETYFGYSVAIKGDWVVIGTPNLYFDSFHPYRAGRAYIHYRHQNGTDIWGRVKELSINTGEILDLFGDSVSIDSDKVVVGAANDDSGKGAAYVYYRDDGGLNNWGEKKKIPASTGLTLWHYDSFGQAVSISMDTILIGMPNGEPNCLAPQVCTDQGAAFVHYRNQGGQDNWGRIKTLRGGGNFSYSGLSVSIKGDTAVISAKNPISGDHPDRQATAYVFNRNMGGSDNWGLVNQLNAPRDSWDDYNYYGPSVAMDYDKVIVGAYYINESRGAAYVFPYPMKHYIGLPLILKN